MAVNRISAQSIESIRLKSVQALPNRPSEQGFKASDIKQAIVSPLINGNHCIAAEINRVVDEINDNLDTMHSEIVLSSRLNALPDLNRSSNRMNALIYIDDNGTKSKISVSELGQLYIRRDDHKPSDMQAGEYLFLEIQNEQETQEETNTEETDNIEETEQGEE